MFIATAVLLVVAAVCGFLLGTRAGQGPQIGVDHAVSPSVGTDENATSAPYQPSLSPSDGSGAEQVVTRFVAAWLDDDPATREAALREVCSPRLAELLTLTDPAKIPQATPTGRPTQVAHDQSVRRFGQDLSDGSSILVDLVPDPTSAVGWTVISVQPGPG